MAQHYVKVREVGGRFRVYWFTVESSGRSYGGAIIGVHQTRTHAIEQAQSVATVRRMEVISA
jgi:phenylalanine-4-hydroxylase